MAASFLLPECLENVFLNLIDEKNPTSNKDVYSCTLVSRQWCIISTPFLYAYPFHHLFYSDSHISNIFKLIRTLLSCIPKSEIEQIISSNSSSIQKFLFRSNKKSSSTDILATFNYVSFIRGLIYNETLSGKFKSSYYRKIWLSSYIPKIKIKNTTEDQFSRISTQILNLLVKFMFKHCKNLKKLEFMVQNNGFLNNTIELLTSKGCNGKSKLSDLEELYYTNKYENISSKDLYSTFSNSVCNLILLHNEGINSIEKAESLSQFISLQKRLRHVILSERFTRNNFDDNYSIVFDSLLTQSETLHILNFKKFSFNNINKTDLNSLCLLKNIRELKLHECKGINDDLHFWAENLTKLEVFELVVDHYTTISEDFLIQLIQSSSDTLTKLILNCGRICDQGCQLFKQIPLYLNLLLIHLELPKIFPNELISIFKSCTRLVYLSTRLSNDEELWEETFKILGKFIPKNLQKFQLNEIDHFLFSIEALRCFLEDCVNNDGKLNYLGIKGAFVVKQCYVRLAREFGVQLIRKRM